MATTTSRQFIDVFHTIRELLPDDVAFKLTQRASYWAPEECWEKLSVFINNHIRPSASDETSVKIYALLCAKSETEMRKIFVENGDN